MDKTIGISEFRQTIAEKIKDVHEHHCRYIIVQRSKARAVLISPDELELLEEKPNKRNSVEFKSGEIRSSPTKKNFL